jgi:HEPN domain-containing protein
MCIWESLILQVYEYMGKLDFASGNMLYCFYEAGTIVIDKAKYWIKLADYDIETARAMLKSGRYLYVGFMCHQTVEKALKGVIARCCAEGEIPPKIHDLSKLSIRAGILDSMTEEQQNFIEDLNPLNIEARYPEYKDEIAAGLTDENCKELITGAEELLCWIKEQL